MELESASKLLEGFRRLPVRIERQRTFMEIAGYPSYENACSNILAFYMDPTESHGFGTLVLDALSNSLDIESAESSMFSNVSVEREVTTESGKRIDIIVTSDTHAILIENKIFAGVDNPFDDYADHLSRNHNSLTGIKILLTLFPSKAGESFDFKNLVYENFIGQVRSLLGTYLQEADARHLTLFLDFINTLEFLQGGTNMEKTSIDFFAERETDIQDLFDHLRVLRTELRTKVQELHPLIDSEKHSNVSQGLWRGSIDSMADVLYFDISVAEDLPVAIDVVVGPGGWHIDLFVRRGGNMMKLRSLLKKLEIPFEEGRRLQYPRRFSYVEPLDDISKLLQDMLDKIAAYEGPDGNN